MLDALTKRMFRNYTELYQFKRKVRTRIDSLKIWPLKSHTCKKLLFAIDCVPMKD